MLEEVLYQSIDLWFNIFGKHGPSPFFPVQLSVDLNCLQSRHTSSLTNIEPNLESLTHGLLVGARCLHIQEFHARILRNITVAPHSKSFILVFGGLTALVSLSFAC